MEGIKPLSTDLIRDLDKEFPPLRSSDIRKNSEKDLAFKAGQRSVVELLQQLQEMQ